MSKPNQFLSPEGDIEDYFVDEYWLIDQYVGDQLWAWGAATGGRLGNAVILNTPVSTPVTTFAGGTNWKQVSVGGDHTSAIKTDGTLWLWGDRFYGRLGNGTTTGFTSTPVTTFAGGSDWRQVSAGTNITAAIKTDGTLWTWGTGTYGRLGNGATSGNISTPVTTFAGGTNWKQVSAGHFNVAAIKTDGTLWTWGERSTGSLGNGVVGSFGTFTSTPVTTFAGGTNWKQVSVSLSFGILINIGGVDMFPGSVVAIKTDGTLWTWGTGTYGKLGNGTISRVLTPITTFAGGTNWKQANVSFRNAAAIKTDGTLWLWGDGFYGNLGNGVATGNISTPVTTFAGGTNWKQVSNNTVTYSKTAAIKTDGTLWVWGNTYRGQLGNGATTGNISTPITTFAGGTNWKQVGSGYRCIAAVQSGISAEYPLS